MRINSLKKIIKKFFFKFLKLIFLILFIYFLIDIYLWYSFYMSFFNIYQFKEVKPEELELICKLVVVKKKVSWYQAFLNIFKF
jgi:hypothetical protein